ncbi:CinA family protein [Streptomyces sp. NPDC003697]
MNAPAADVVRLLAGRGETVAVAESLTGGLVAAEITSVPGASKVFRGSVTAYATELKHLLLGVDATLLAEHGAVHPQVAAQMAAGVRRALGTDWGIATTGVAGPDPQDGQPVGTVFVAVDGPRTAGFGAAHGGKTASLRLNGERAEIRMETVQSVLALLIEQIAGEQTGNEWAQDTERNGGF